MPPSAASTEPSPERLTVAVSIATHNRLFELKRTLGVVMGLSPAPDEVWVAADGCDDGTADWVREHHPSVQLLEFNPASGHIRARDRVLREQGCDLVLSLDDDSYPLDTDAVAQIRNAFAGKPNLAALLLPQRTDEFPATLEQADFGPAKWVGRYIDASVVLRARAVLEVGGLPTDYWQMFSEPDTALRLLAASWDLRYEPSPVVRHHFTFRNRSEIRNHRSHALNEQLSLWRYCPMPQAWLLSKYRSFSQLRYAASRHWPVWKTEPVWWWQLLKKFGPNLKRRRPLPWPVYREWIRLGRHGWRSEAAWRRRQRVMGVRDLARDREVAAPSKTESPCRIAFAATNPCHVYDLALALADRRALAGYLSGYPRWKLRDAEGLPVFTHAWPTVTTYALLKFFPGWVSRRQRDWFAWQDQQFDDWAAGQIHRLERADFIHGLPGQCAATFAAARGQGVATVLNHAAGPEKIQSRLVAEEFRAAGLRPPAAAAPPVGGALGEEQARHQEYAWADWHVAASRIVRDQLVASGVAADRIGVVPYGADGEIFHPATEVPRRFQILFAGTLCLRKGLRYLFQALEQGGESAWRLRMAGPESPEMEPFLRAFRPACQVEKTGPVSQSALADLMRASSVLVLPSVEEAFGLVVVQALSCGLPCIVSDRVGAADLLVHRENGSVVPFGDVDALLEELCWWSENPTRVGGDFGWERPAAQMLDWSRMCLARGREEEMMTPCPQPA